MASLLYAWEFGAGLGHVGPFLPLGRALRERGHAVRWAVAQPAAVGRLLARDGFAWLPAPRFPEPADAEPPLTYADILLRYGYGDVDSLFGLTGAWRELMRLCGAALILADHAPTAVLAARTLGLPVMLFSTGFTLPPRRCPTPNMRPWRTFPPERLQAPDTAACASVNAVLAEYGRPALSMLAELFDGTEATLVTFPELDHYADRGDARYWGSLPSAGAGRRVDWPPQPGHRLFAYLRAEYRHHEAVLAMLHARGEPAIIYMPDLTPPLRARFAAPHLRFADAPVDLDQMAREADAAITYASLATTTAFLLAGKPLLLVPNHLEQFLLARRVEALGAGCLVNPERPAGDLQAMLAELLHNPACRRQAEAFARRYAAFDQATVQRNMLRRIESLLAGGEPLKETA